MAGDVMVCPRAHQDVRIVRDDIQRAGGQMAVVRLEPTRGGQFPGQSPNPLNQSSTTR